MHTMKLMQTLPRALRYHPRMFLLTSSKPRTQHLQPCLWCSDKILSSSDLQSRRFSKVTDNHATELYFEEIFEHGFSGEDPLFDLRNYFYPDSDDPHIFQLANAGCVLEVLECVTQIENPKHQHVTQAVATIHHLSKLSGFVGQADYYEDYRNNTAEFNKQLKEHEMFGTLCSIIRNNLEQFPFNELSFLMMVLKKFDEPLSSPVLREIYLRLQENLDSLDIETLSYMSVGLRQRFHTDKYRFVWRLGLVRAMPRLQHLLLNCKTPEDLRKVVICFYNMASLISDKMMEQLIEKVTEFIEAGSLSSPSELSVLCKLLALLVAKSDWHLENGKYVHLLLSQFIGKTKYLRPVNAVMLCKVVTSYGEPVSLYFEVYQRLCDILETKQFQGNIPMISCLSSVLRINPSAVPLKDLEEIVETIINSEHLADHVSDVYQILRSVGIINKDLVDKFYMESFKALKLEPSNELVRFAARYCDMHSVYTGSYYNREFEQKIVKFLLEEELNGKNCIILPPLEFARRVGLLITFGYQLNPVLFQKFKDLLPQLCPNGLLSISRGVEHQLKKNRKDLLNVSTNPVPRDQRSEYLEWLEEMSIMVNRACGEKLEERGVSDVNIIDLAYLMKNFISRSDCFDEESFNFVKRSLADKINQGKASISIAGKISHLLSFPRVKIESPELIDSLVKFFLSRPDPNEIHTEVLRKPLQYCYEVGNKPDQLFLDVVSRSLHRDIDSLPGVTCLQLAQILCSYNNISKQLVSALFSNEFMARLDKELEMASDRRHHPKQLRRNLMELNRAVVLRYPEFGVPWFHSKYCLEHKQDLKQNRRSVEDRALKDEVAEQLNALTGGWRYVKEDSYSEYYNNIDFEVHYDERGHPIDMDSRQSVIRKVKKFAIQVLPSNSFTIDTRKMGGVYQTQTRELELQGWHVINVNPYSWKSMQMGESKAKKQYLEQTIAQAVVL